MPRSTWSGFLKLSLVTVPVKAYSANSNGGSVPLHQLHRKCHSRIKYKKFCPIHGEVNKDEIISGYEYSKGEYVMLEPDELDAASGERAIEVDAVLPTGSVDPLYYTEKAYYLVPDGDAGQKPYQLLKQGLAEEDLEAVARGVLFGREELVLLRPCETVLLITALKYEAEVRHAESVESEVHPQKLPAAEAKLTASLLKAFHRKDFTIADYEDKYVEKLKAVIDAKVAGREVVAPASAPMKPVVNLMAALKKSIADKGETARAGAKHRKRKLRVWQPSQKESPPRRRKSG